VGTVALSGAIFDEREAPGGAYHTQRWAALRMACDVTPLGTGYPRLPDGEAVVLDLPGHFVGALITVHLDIVGLVHCLVASFVGAFVYAEVFSDVRARAASERKGGS
jgi:hypothetical protein